MITQHYRDLKTSYEETRSLIHDFKNHFRIISSAYANGNEELANKTINQFNYAYEKIKIKYDTGYEILDILLNLNKDIDFDFKCE